MGLFDSIDQCYCGHEFKKREEFCPKCGRRKYRMSLIPGHEDSVEINMKNMKLAKDFAKTLCAFQLARSKGEN